MLPSLPFLPTSNPLTPVSLSPPSLRPPFSASVIRTQQSAGTIPRDTNALYAVLTSSGIKQGTGSDSFCSTYCGWHGAYTVSASVYKYMFVGWSGDCGGCKGQFVR